MVASFGWLEVEGEQDFIPAVAKLACIRRQRFPGIGYLLSRKSILEKLDCAKTN